MRRSKFKVKSGKSSKGGPLAVPELKADEMLSGFLSPAIHKSFKRTSKLRKQRHD